MSETGFSSRKTLLTQRNIGKLHISYSFLLVGGWCGNKTTANLGWHYFGGPLAPFKAFVGNLRQNMNMNELTIDNKSALIFDYTVDL